MKTRISKILMMINWHLIIAVIRESWDNKLAHSYKDPMKYKARHAESIISKYNISLLRMMAMRGDSQLQFLGQINLKNSQQSSF